MRVISPLDLRRSLGAILDAASTGERFVIERDRRPMAMLVSVEDGRRLDPDADEARSRRLAALDRLEALGRRASESRLPVPPRLAPPPAPVPTAPPTPSSRPASRAAPERPTPAAAPASPTAAGAAMRQPVRPIDRFEAERRRHALGDEVVPGG